MVVTGEAGAGRSVAAPPSPAADGPYVSRPSSTLADCSALTYTPHRRDLIILVIKHYQDKAPGE